MIKLIKKNKIIFFVLLILAIGIVTTLGRFVYNEVKKNLFTTKDFYFNSDKLREKQVLYRIDNYNGVDDYNILINMNSIKNNLVIADTDINYDISIDCTNANCSVSKEEGIVLKSTGRDYFTVSMSPLGTMNSGDSMVVEVIANSTTPYKKELSAKFMLVVGNYGLSHEINDEVNKTYFEVKITNTLDYYTILETFDNYQIGDKIDIVTYMALPEVDKTKCASAIVNLAFDPNVVLFDNASGVDGLMSQTTTTINTYDYINGLSFKIEPVSSAIVRFYKKNSQLNYTYPIVNPTSIVAVTYNT